MYIFARTWLVLTGICRNPKGGVPQDVDRRTPTRPYLPHIVHVTTDWIPPFKKSLSGLDADICHITADCLYAATLAVVRHLPRKWLLSKVIPPIPRPATRPTEMLRLKHTKHAQRKVRDVVLNFTRNLHCIFQITFWQSYHYWEWANDRRQLPWMLWPLSVSGRGQPGPRTDHQWKGLSAPVADVNISAPVRDNPSLRGRPESQLQ